MQGSCQSPDAFLSFSQVSQVPLNFRPLACTLNAHKLFVLRVDTEPKVTPFPPVPYKPTPKKRKKHKGDGDFAELGYQSFDISTQTVVFVDNRDSEKEGISFPSSKKCRTKLGLFAVPYLERKCTEDGDVYFGLIEKKRSAEVV